LRLLLLCIVGPVLIGAALWLRSSSYLRETILRSKDLPELEAAVRQNPNDSIAQYYLAKRYYLSRRFDAARTAYNAAERLEPKSARTHLGLGLTLFELHDLSEARSEFEETLRLDPRATWAEYMLGKLDWLHGDFKAAIPHLQHATKLDPRSAPTWYGLGSCYTQQQRFSEALDAMQQAAAHDDSAKYETAIGELNGILEHPDEARRHYERALQLDPNYGPACALAGSYYLHHPSNKNDLDRAEELLLRAEHLPTYRPQDVYLDLGELYLQKGQAKEAVAALEEAIRRDPRDEHAYYTLVKAYRMLGDAKATAAAEARFKFFSDRHVQRVTLESRIAHVPNDADAHLKLARVYRDIGMTQKAIQQYTAFHQLQPHAPAVTQEFEAFLRELMQPASGGLDQDFVSPALR
jgi:tetratricopeptide (TPR) repeat protein